jgi:soluble lytic murein transglycosylase-like protein
MIPNLNINMLTRFKADGLISANKRVDQINETFGKVENNNTTATSSFSDLLPNTQTNEPVKLLNPKTMISLIQKNASKYGVNPKLLNSIIKNESGYNVNAKSTSGAVGLMQLMPATAKEMGCTDITDPTQNIEAGAKYLSKMIHKYNGNVVLAVAAYNAGPGNVDKYKSIPPYKETQKYVMNVLDTYLAKT